MPKRPLTVHSERQSRENIFSPFTPNYHVSFLDGMTYFPVVNNEFDDAHSAKNTYPGQSSNFLKEKNEAKG